MEYFPLNRLHGPAFAFGKPFKTHYIFNSHEDRGMLEQWLAENSVPHLLADWEYANENEETADYVQGKKVKVVNEVVFA